MPENRYLGLYSGCSEEIYRMVSYHLYGLLLISFSLDNSAWAGVLRNASPFTMEKVE